MVQVVAFAAFLKQYRARAQLSQEELAARAGLSVRAISDLERGLKQKPRTATVRLLVEALRLSEQERAAFEAAARGEGPSAVASPTRPHNLPLQLTSFVGRAQDVEAVGQLLGQPEVRLLTLTGPGGTGKTRLALRVAEALLHHFADGVYFVDLTPLADAELVLQEIAATLGVGETTEVALRARLTEHLRTRCLLLVLDNFERVVLAGGLLTQLLMAAPRLKLLVSSRVVLRVRGEYEYDVPPLAIPPPVPVSTPEEVSRYEAVQLFLTRARAVRPDFAITAGNAQAIAEICRRLDGLPLAIELAAARVRLLSPQAMLARLADRFVLLTGGAQDGPARQRTLRATLDWSYQLLDSTERRLLARLAVFAGGCTLDAVEVVGGDPAAEAEVLEGVSSLLDKSLLRRVEQPAGGVRFEMLETIREYALARLAERGEAPAAQERHARYFLALAERAEAELTGPRQVEWLDQLETEHDNLRAAVEWSRACGDLELALRLGAALWRFWFIRGYFADWERWLATLRTQLLADGELGAAAAPSSADFPLPIPNLEPPALRRYLAKALLGRAVLLLREEHFDRAASFAAPSLELSGGVGDQWGIAASLVILGKVAALRSEEQWTVGRLAEGVALARAVGDPWLLGWALFNLGEVAWSFSDYVPATAAFEESLSVCRSAGDKQGTAWALTMLGWLAARHACDYERATMLLEGAEAIFREMRDQLGVANALLGRGMVALAQRDYALARALNQERQAIEQALGNKHGVGHAHVWLGLIAAAQGNYSQAFAHWEESLAIYHELDNNQNRAWVHNHWGWTALDRGLPEQAHLHFEESLALSRDVRDQQGVAHVLGGLGEVAFAQGDYAQAAVYWNDSLARWHAVGDARGTAAALAELAKVARVQGNQAAAQTLEAESLALQRDKGAQPDSAGWQSPWRDWRR